MAGSTKERMQALNEKQQKLQEKHDATINQLVKTHLGEIPDENVLAGVLVLALKAHAREELLRVGSQWFRDRRSSGRKTSKGHGKTPSSHDQDTAKDDDDESLI